MNGWFWAIHVHHHTMRNNRRLIERTEVLELYPFMGPILHDTLFVYFYLLLNDILKLSVFSCLAASLRNCFLLVQKSSILSLRLS